MVRSRDDPGAASSPTEGPQDWALRMETCRIELSRGDVTSLFFATSDGTGTLAAICEPSSGFRWRGRRAPDTPEARLAHYELVARLKANGWAKTSEGEEWYAFEFTRSTLVPHAGSRTIESPAEPTVPAAPAPPPVVVEQSKPHVRVTPRPSQDWWRYAAGSGLVVAVVLLIWALAHAA